jgi:uncharacterized protein (DUF924 family)
MSAANHDAGTDSRAGDLLLFWFGADLAQVPAALQKRWFTRDPAFDAEVFARFLALYRAALGGELDEWRQSPLRCLAFVILVDQLPRNMFRGAPAAFGSDALALSAAREAVARRFDRDVPPIARAFFYLPFEHSEDLADQDECAFLFAQWPNEPELASFADYALRHRQVIARFGRFPHRNDVLGRLSSPEEIAFLRQPGSSF